MRFAALRHIQRVRIGDLSGLAPEARRGIATIQIYSSVFEAIARGTPYLRATQNRIEARANKNDTVPLFTIRVPGEDAPSRVLHLLQVDPDLRSLFHEPPSVPTDPLNLEIHLPEPLSWKRLSEIGSNWFKELERGPINAPEDLAACDEGFIRKVEKAAPVIIVVDDERGFLEEAKEWLSDIPGTLLTSEEGSRAQDLIFASSPDVVVLDAIIPWKRGYDDPSLEPSAQLYRKNPDTNFILVSAKNENEVRFVLGPSAKFVQKATKEFWPQLVSEVQECLGKI